MQGEDIKKLLESIVEKIEMRDQLLIDLTKEIALLRMEIKENQKM